jgi:uncharacterized protein involved in exopolysaccharide biosynthesis
MGAVTGYLLSGVSPDYRSEARIQVVLQRIPDDIVPAPAPPNLEDRLATISQPILTRTRLERLILDLNLFTNERRSGVIMQDVVELMHKNISITVDNRQAGDAASMFIVSYTGKDRRAAQQVAEKLAGFFIDESLRDGAQRAESTSLFVESLIGDTGRRLAAHDERMAAARAAGGRDSARMQIEGEVIRGTYKALLEKREQALMRLNMERKQIGEQFRLVEPARIPERPIGPARSAAAAAGGLAGLALALVVNLFFVTRRALASRAPQESTINGGI